MNKLLVFLLITMPRISLAQSPQPATVPRLPSQATLVEDVLVPIPSEIFGTLDHFADSNWRRVQRPELARCDPGKEQAQTALRLGAVIAEGFIAVEAQDAAEVKDIGNPGVTDFDAAAVICRLARHRAPHESRVAIIVAIQELRPVEVARRCGGGVLVRSGQQVAQGHRFTGFRTQPDWFFQAQRQTLSV